MTTEPTIPTGPVSARSDQLMTSLIHALLVGLIVVSTVVLAALHAIDQATVAAILGTSLGYTGGTSAARRITDTRTTLH